MSDDKHEVQTFRLQFYMKSGNNFIVNGVTEYCSASRNGSIVRISLKQKNDPRFSRLDIESLDLRAVEAVVILPIEASDPVPSPASEE